MYAEERRQLIVDRTRDDGRVEVAGLARDLHVTAETVRRDLTDLEQRGLLRRVHGGAIPADRLRAESAVADRIAVMAEEKSRIAEAALAYVPLSGTIILDAGTTTDALAAALPADRQVTVVTNSPTIALTLSSRPDTEPLLLGGRVRGTTLAAVDDWALRTLAELSVDVAFVATNGVDLERGLTTHDPSEAAIKREMVRCGRRVVLLADHSKFGADHLVRFATLEDIDVLITDDGIDPRVRAAFADAGAEVVLA